MKQYVKIAALCVFVLGLSACAKPNPNATVYDPIEPVNRKIFDFNVFFYHNVATPVGKAYVAAVPEFLRDRVRDFSRNLYSPVNLANNILQGNIDGAADTLARFLTNTLIGVGGLIDVAGPQKGYTGGIPYRSEDFGQTLATWGIGEGPYLVIPIRGPSNLRDASGLLVDSFLLDGVNIWAKAGGHDWIPWARAGVSGLDFYSRNMNQLRKLEESSVDFYAAMRSLYHQARQADIQDRGGKTLFGHEKETTAATQDEDFDITSPDSSSTTSGNDFDIKDPDAPTAPAKTVKKPQKSKAQPDYLQGLDDMEAQTK